MYSSICINDTLTEVKFLEEFITNICSEDNKITLNTSLSDLEADYATGDKTPSFEIKIGNAFKLIFSHPYLSGYSNGLKVELKKFDEVSTTVLTQNLVLGNGIGTSPNTAAERKMYYTVVTNNNVVSLMIGSYNTNLNTNWDFDLCFLLDNNKQGVAMAYSTTEGTYVTTTPAASSNFYFNDTNLVTTTAYNRMGYTFSTEKTLEYTRSKVFVDGSTQEYYTTSSIFDCSVIEGAHKHIIIEGEEYYSLNTNTLILI